MAKLKIDDHPTVKLVRARRQPQAAESKPLDAKWLRQLALDCGADDAGLVEIERAALDDERPEIVDVELRWSLASGISGEIDLPVLFERVTG